MSDSNVEAFTLYATDEAQKNWAWQNWANLARAQVGLTYSFRNTSSGKSLFVNDTIWTNLPSYDDKFNKRSYTTLTEGLARVHLGTPKDPHSNPWDKKTRDDIPFYILRFQGGGEADQEAFPCLSSSSDSKSGNKLKKESTPPDVLLDLAPVGYYTQLCAWMQLCSKNSSIVPSIVYCMLEYMTADWNMRFLTPMPAYWTTAPETKQAAEAATDVQPPPVRETKQQVPNVQPPPAKETKQQVPDVAMMQVPPDMQETKQVPPEEPTDGEQEARPRKRKPSRDATTMHDDEATLSIVSLPAKRVRRPWQPMSFGEDEA